MSETALTRLDLQALLADPSPDRQAEVTRLVAAAWRDGTLDPKARLAAEALFRTIAKQAAVAVRAALSATMKDAEDLPHDIAVKLASDVDHVALPMLEASSVLTDEDLLGLVLATSSAGLAAIAGRASLSAHLADAVIERGDVGAVARLVGNPGAALSDASLDRVADRYGAIGNVAEPLAGRGGLPARVAAKLMAIVSDQLHRHLSNRGALDPDLLADLKAASEGKKPTLQRAA